LSNDPFRTLRLAFLTNGNCFCKYSNRELDGFCPNEVPIELRVSKNDPLYDAKYEFWTRGEGDGNSAMSSQHSTNITAAVAAAVDVARSQQLDPAVAMHSAMQAAVSAAANDIQNGKRHGGPGSRSQSMNSYESAKRIRVCVSNNENTRVLFSMLRVLACNEDELCTISSSPTLPFGDSGCSGFLNRALRGFTGGHPDSTAQSMQHVAFFRTARDIRHPLSLRNEKAAMRHLLKVIKSHLNLYPCSLAQDVADLMEEDSFPRFSNRRHAKIQIRGEKEVLHHFALWAKTAIDLIEIIEREIVIAENGESNNLVLPQKSFEFITRTMEENEGLGQNGLHHTIVRYCCDVLGALRKEGLKSIKRENELAKLQESRSC
jgi:hypothetical protein